MTLTTHQKKDQTPYLENYTLKIPKQEIRKMVLKELNKSYPDYTNLKAINKRLHDMGKRIRNLESVLVER